MNFKDTLTDEIIELADDLSTEILVLEFYRNTSDNGHKAANIERTILKAMRSAHMLELKIKQFKKL